MLSRVNPMIRLLVIITLLPFFGSSQEILDKVWIGENMSYLEISQHKAFLGFYKIDTFEFKFQKNQIILKRRKFKISLPIIKTTKDSLVILSKENFKGRLYLEKDTLLFVPRDSFVNRTFLFISLDIVYGDSRYVIDSSGMFQLTKFRPRGTYSSRLNETQKSELKRLLRGMDLTKLPSELPQPGFHDPINTLDITYLNPIYNRPFPITSFGYYFPYVCRDLLSFIENLPKVLELKRESEN